MKAEAGVQLDFIKVMKKGKSHVFIDNRNGGTISWGPTFWLTLYKIPFNSHTNLSGKLEPSLYRKGNWTQ